MDIPRPSQARQQRLRRIVYGGGGLVAILLVTVGLGRLRPVAPSVDRAAVWIDTVRRGPMLRQVRGVLRARRTRGEMCLELQIGRAHV